nr:transient receptor potential cation channel subfamily M member-like 2 [Dermacentor andersoni]
MAAAANTTAMWILTNGINIGIAKEIGSRVNDELVQRQIMRCHKHPHTDFEKLPPLCLLGIVREDLLTCADKFEANKEGSIYIENSGSRPEENKYDLNPDHTHFIIVKDDTVNKTGLNYFMLKLEQHLASFSDNPDRDASALYSAEIPLIAIVCQGGTGCNKMVLEHIKKQLPVLVIQGSGGVADLLALAYNEIDRRGVTIWDPEFIENVLKPEINSHICQMFPKFRDNALSRNLFRDKIVECLRIASQTQDQMYFTVINIQHHHNNLQHLDDILVKAVFKLQHHQAHQIKKDLLLTLDWNCPHVAMTKVFSKDFAQQYQIDREDFEYALLKPKREEFLHIFLNRGFLIHKYLDPKRLRQLFAKIQHEEFFRTVCWEGALGHSLLSKIGRNFIETDLNWLIETTTSLRDFLNQEELSANSAVGTYVKDAASAERKALVILSLWAVFTNRRKTAEVLWKNCDQPIHLALLVSMTYEKLTAYVSEGTIKQELLDTSKQFAAMASGVLNLCYLESRCRAYDILSVQTADWKYKTAVDIAAEASNRQFLSHPCCQKWLTNHFLGRISVRDSQWGFFSVPLSLKVILCAFTFFPMYIWVRFKSDPHQREYGEEEECERDYGFSKSATENVKGDRYDSGATAAQEGTFIRMNPGLYKMVYLMWSAPITKFWVHQGRRRQGKTLSTMKGQKLSDRDYHYWKQKALEYSNNADCVNENTLQNHYEKLTLILEDIDYQRTVLDQLQGQVQEVQRKISLSIIHLETLKQVSLRSDPTMLTTSMPAQAAMHYISRQSPYPGTKIQRFPVPDKFLPWEVMWLDYDPVTYTRPRSQFPGPLQIYVDEDILMLSTGEHVQSLPSLKWNCLSMSPAGISTDRRSWIVDTDGTNIVYILESEGVPRNPAGRTGLKGKGALPRWGPNHYVLFIISRYQKSRSALLQGRGLEIALMKIYRTDQFVLPGDFVPGEQKYEGVMRVCFKIPDGMPMTTAEHVKGFFSARLSGNADMSDSSQVMECSIARRGYMDDPMNTDNCWREVELWKIHYCVKEKLTEKFQVCG